MSSESGLPWEDMQEIIDEFLVEADELIAVVDRDLVSLEAAPDSPDLLNEIFRAAHTIKGTSSFLGLEPVTVLTHRMEDILNQLRKSDITVTAEVMDVLLDALDVLKTLLVGVRNGAPDETDLTGILARIEALGKTEATAPVDCLRAAPAEALRSVPTAEQTIRVDVARLDALMNLVGELVLGRNSLMRSMSRLTARHEGEPDVEAVVQTSAALGSITTELQTAVMKMRLQPIGKVFSRLPRLVRDLARDTGKAIDLVITGEATELDKSVIEEIGDPLVHMIRNSCDHGLESPEERAAAGKPLTGTVTLAAGQEGSQIVVTIGDDGRGLDAGAIRAKAVERGLIGRAEADALSDRDVFKFVFEPGFSTAETITDVSGRGVGMDVVRANIEKLRGTVTVDSTPGEGTTITIRLPLTLAIIQGLIVQAGPELYVLPMASVIETVRLDPGRLRDANRRPVLCLRDEIIPVVDLAGLLSRDYRGVLFDRPYAVIVGLADRKLALAIDGFKGQEEVVIKSLGQYLESTRGVAGATLLGDGRVRLIVDIAGLIEAAGEIEPAGVCE